MKYIHSKQIIHRDLKPKNILIGSDEIVKVCDFGISKIITIEEQTMTRGIGSRMLMAPEILDDEKADVYSFGVVVFFILSGGELPKIKLSDLFKGKKAELPSSFTDFSKKRKKKKKRSMTAGTLKVKIGQVMKLFLII